MPQLSAEQQDALDEAVSRQLFRINKVVKAMFGQELSDEEILHAHRRVTQGVQGTMRQMEEGTYQGLPPGGSRIVGQVRQPGGAQFGNTVLPPGPQTPPMNLRLNPMQINPNVPRIPGSTEAVSEVF